MKKRFAIALFLGLFLLSGNAPDAETEVDWVKLNTRDLGGEYWTNNMTSSFRIYPSDYNARKIASIMNSKDTIK